MSSSSAVPTPADSPKRGGNRDKNPDGTRKTGPDTGRTQAPLTGQSGRDPIVLLIAGTSLLMASGSMVFTLLPALQDEVDFPTWGFGVIAGVFFASSLVAQLFLARFADRGRAKAMLVSAALLAVLGLLLMAYGSTLTQLTIARGIGGLATGCWAPAARATAIAGRPDQTARRLSYIAMGDTSGLVIGPLVGAALVAAFSLRTAFIVFAVLALLLLPLIFVSNIVEVSRTSTTTRLTDLVTRRPVLQAVVLGVALFLPVGMYETVWGKHISNLGGSTFVIALSVALYGLPYMIMAPIGGRLGDRLGPARVAIFGSVALVIVTVITGVPRNYWILIPVGVIEAGISAIAYPNALAAVSKAASRQEQATAQGLAGGASIAGAGVMALISGPVFEFAGPFATFSTAAALVAVGALVAFRMDPAAFAPQVGAPATGDGDVGGATGRG
ncbi:MAG: MFS transporter [Actinomycetota bacterium]